MARQDLVYAVNLTSIFKYMGYPIAIVGFLTFAPFLASLYYQDWSLSVTYFASGLFSLLLGGVIIRWKHERKILFNEAVCVVCFAYLYAAFMAAIPFYVSGMAFDDAFFEAVSAITTTGLTVIDNWQQTPMTTFFSRAWLQWCGGLGIVIIFLAFLMRQGEVAKKISRFESSPDDVVGGSKAHAKSITTVYCLISLVGFIMLFGLGLGFSDALMFTFSSVSTGGFSSYSDSLASLDFLPVLVIMGLSFVCAFSLPFYYKLWHSGLNMTLQGSQVIGLFAIAAMVAICLGSTYDMWLLALSAQTTTGFSTVSSGDLSQTEKLLLSFSMISGGGVGSTAGGLKVLRLFFFLAYFKSMLVQLSQTEHAVYHPSIFGISVTQEQLQRAMGLIGAYVLLTYLSWVVFTAMGYDAVDSLFEVSSAVGTVGLSSGITQNTLPLLLKGLLCFDMLLGRLEIVPWLIIMYPRTWLGARRETI